MKKIMFLFAAFMLLGVVVKAQTNLTGVWKRNDGTTIVITKPKGDPVYFLSLPGQAFAQTTRLVYKGANTFTGILERVNLGDGCTTYITIKLRTSDNNHFSWEGKGGDANCDVPATYRENFSVEKVLDF